MGSSAGTATEHGIRTTSRSRKSSTLDAYASRQSRSGLNVPLVARLKLNAGAVALLLAAACAEQDCEELLGVACSGREDCFWTGYEPEAEGACFTRCRSDEDCEVGSVCASRGRARYPDQITDSQYFQRVCVEEEP